MHRATWGDSPNRDPLETQQIDGDDSEIMGVADCGNPEFRAGPSGTA